MHVTLKCPNCGERLPLAITEPGASEAVASPEVVTCGGCRATIPLAVTAGVQADRTVDACPLCEGKDFYLRKDFDPKLGLTVVIIGALISAGFYWYGLDLIAYCVLGVAALIDLFVYGRLKNLTVCYRCHTEFRGRYTPTAPFFDLATADELELEWFAEAEKRWPASPPPAKAASGA